MKRLFFVWTLFLPLVVLSQDQTVGLFSVSPGSYEGYTLFAPTRSNSTYLIDHCGNLVNEWVSAYTPGNSAYLLENGNLLKACRINGVPVVSAGGYGGIVQILDWDSNVVWEYAYNNDTVMQHHDLAWLPNGNVLILAWEAKTMEEAIQAGRNPGVITGAGIYPVHIVEVEPVGQDSGTIVWEWHVWDHLVQDYDPTKDNYGVVEDHPELLDINYHPANNGVDWLHCNSIDYNPSLDQIIISSRFNDEIYVIDHSTTTEEAAGHTGGNSGKGGDILYRWGNPIVYERGDDDDRKFYRQHDASWIPDGLPNEGKIMVFNNGFGLVGPDFSTVEIVNPPQDNDGNYIISGGLPYGPSDSETYFTAPNPPDFFTAYMGSAQMQPNGNLLLCESQNGRFLEVDPLGNTVWEYVNPSTGAGIVTQGDPIPTAPGLENTVFRVYRYPPDFPGLAGVDLTPGNPIENEPWDYNCPISTSVNDPQETGVWIYPNPVADQLVLHLPKGTKKSIQIINALGVQIYQGETSGSFTDYIDVRGIPPGLYIIYVENYGAKKFCISR